jgi:hypothetical protein
VIEERYRQQIDMLYEEAREYERSAAC